MQYIAAIDYEHLDNGVFLTSLARSISQQGSMRSIIVHGDSAYTERIMQTGVMREEATIRSIKDLNHRLIALFADQGVSAIGLNGYQRKFITREAGALSLDSSFYESLPHQPVLLISTLVWDVKTEMPVAVPLATMTSFLKTRLNVNSVFAFSRSDKHELIIQDTPQSLLWDELSSEFAEEHLPEELREFKQPLNLTTARDFHHPFERTSAILLK